MRIQALASQTRLYFTSRAHGSHHMTFPPNPHASTTRVWCIDLNASLAALLMLEAEAPRLSDVDRSRASRFSSGQAAREWMAAHVALRLVLEHSLGSGARRIPFRVSPSGKPDLPGSGIAFSLSHGAGHALIATGAVGPLGVDIEGGRAIRMAGDRRTSIESAGAGLSSQALPFEPDARFLQAWVRLEALSKAQGEGLARVLSRAGAFGAERGKGVSGTLLPGGIQVSDLALGSGLYAAVAMAVGATGAHVGFLPAEADELRAFALG
jgi:4'-phosphopantetheinyl transferase